MPRLLYLLPFLLLACASDEPTEEKATFDRGAMLAHWADNLIVPAYQDFTAAARALDASVAAYAAAPSATTLTVARGEFETAYLSWQRLSPLMVGPGQELRLREQINVYPTDTARLLGQANDDLTLPSNVDVQGFPALDFYLYGTGDPARFATELSRLTARIVELSAAAEAAWTGGYRDTYVASSGNSATASVDRTVNVWLEWYERNLRAGKVGIPAGIFGSTPLPDRAEAPYHGGLSKALFLEALDAADDFFSSDPSLAAYLDALEVRRDGELLSSRIRAQFRTARERATGLDANFATQVRTDHTAMLQLYDALQANVVLIKVDMLQALGINVDFVDADGD
ncbi:imelysin family protein [Neolewinella sp.]|uniref:imelysin family protein n=1 Tax=Neolewinella sp. TaxID=2993543 RepID=UPI003B528B33